MLADAQVLGARVLLIEDDRDIAHMFGRGLRHYGHEVTLVADGRKGLEAALTSDVDIVLLDLRLPGLDGLEVLRRLRAERPQLPVAVLSNQSDPQVAEAAKELGICGYLLKSRVTPAVVAGAIRRWLGDKRADH